MTPDADLVIVGAGPAGAAAACHFARAGFRVVLIDRQRFPRDKVCGDFVGPWALEELDRLELSSRAPFCNSNKIRHAALHLNGKKVVGASIPHPFGLRDHGLCIPRVQMDEAIVEAAVASGAFLLQDSCVKAYEADARGVTVFYQDGGRPQYLRTRLLFGADGSASLIARILRGKPPPRRDRIIAVRAYFDDVGGPADQAGLYAVSAAFPGYYWLFPSETNSANVGIGMLLETSPPNKQHLPRFLANIIRSDPAIRFRLGNAKMRGKIVGWPLATFNPHLPIVADRVALIGDAAGLINPLNGEGIQYALHSARWSVETLREPLLCDRLSVADLATYANRVQGEMRFDMAVSRLLVDLSRNRALNQLWLSALEVIGSRAALDREYADVFGGVLAGIARARDVLAMPFVRSTLKQAISMTARSASLDALRASASMAKYSIEHPATTLDWGIQCALGVFELSTQVTKHQPGTVSS